MTIYVYPDSSTANDESKLVSLAYPFLIQQVTQLHSHLDLAFIMKTQHHLSAQSSHQASQHPTIMTETHYALSQRTVMIQFSLSVTCALLVLTQHTMACLLVG